ncbi:MAG: hypothetical protein Q8K32_17755 [Archangium sp.]|nr:hypothetical protein [Archangium sp.]
MNTEKLAALAAQGSRVFLSAVPRIALGGLGGAFTGFFIMGVLGALLSFASAMMWRGNPDIPAWLSASLFVTPLVLAVAGVFLGGVRGLLAALAGQLQEKKLVAYLYAQVKPAIVVAVQKSSGANPQQLAAEVQAQLSRTFAGEPGQKQESVVDRLAHWVTMRSRRVLALTLVTHVARAENGAAAAGELEKLGVAKLEEIVVGNLEDLFALKLTLVAGGALLLSFVPQAIWWIGK